MRKSRSYIALCIFTLLAIVSGAPVWAADAPAKEGEAEGKSLTELNKELANPISSLFLRDSTWSTTRTLAGRSGTSR